MSEKQSPKELSLSRKSLRQELSKLPAKKRMDALIDRQDAKQAVRSLPPEEMYVTIQEVGLADAPELVQLSSPSQFRAYVDLAGWKKDELDAGTVLTWLRAARGDEPEDFIAKLFALDLELLELLVRHYTTIHDLEENPDVNPAGVTMESPEGKYLLEFHAEGVDLAALRQLLQDLIAKDPFQAGRLFEAIRWEVPIELSEVAYRFRQARLQDLGFPPFEEAVSLYAAARIKRAAPQAAGLARETGHLDYVQAALNGLSPEEREKVDEELRYLFNQALVADGADPGDLAAFRAVAERARDTLNLGLEYLTGGDAAKGGEVFRDHPPKRVFQTGFGLTLDLKFAADRLFQDEPVKRLGTVMLLDEERAYLEALRRRRPMKALRTPGADPVPFRSFRELSEGQALIERAREQVRLLNALAGGSEEEARALSSRFNASLERLGADRLFAAAVAHAALDGKPEAKPLDPARLPDLCAKLFFVEDAKPAVRREAVEAAASAFANPAARPWIERLLGQLAEELGRPYAAQGVVDPKHVWLLPIAGQPLL